MPEKPGRYFVYGRFFPNESTITKGCVTFHDGRWHVSKYCEIIEWLPDEGNKAVTTITEGEMKMLRKVTSLDLISFNANGRYTYHEHEEVDNFESRRRCKVEAGFGNFPYAGVVWLLCNGYKIPQI